MAQKPFGLFGVRIGKETKQRQTNCRLRLWRRQVIVAIGGGRPLSQNLQFRCGQGGRARNIGRLRTGAPTRRQRGYRRLLAESYGNELAFILVRGEPSARTTWFAHGGRGAQPLLRRVRIQAAHELGDRLQMRLDSKAERLLLSNGF